MMPVTMPSQFHGYYSRPGFDVDCADVSYSEAQELTTADGSDPFRLDADSDGVACEARSRVDRGAVGYPVGGVATGDGTTGTTDASPAGLALAGAGVGGLALAGLTLVRRFGRQV